MVALSPAAEDDPVVLLASLHKENVDEEKVNEI